jgi:hypothetical protein
LLIFDCGLSIEGDEGDLKMTPVETEIRLKTFAARQPGSGFANRKSSIENRQSAGWMQGIL